jgi:hypothetical protein
MAGTAMGLACRHRLRPTSSLTDSVFRLAGGTAGELR